MSVIITTDVSLV